MTEHFTNRLLRMALGVALVALPTFAQQYHSNDLTPPYSATGKLHGASKGKQVGGGGNAHAYLLTGNALTAVDLHPAVGFTSSMATSGDDFSQCGYGYSNLGGIHAMKWSGSSNSAVDLHPSGYNFSYCTGVDGDDQGGFAEQQSYFVTASHAMLWHGTSAAVDLHPISAGVPYSRVMGVKSGEEVGYVSSVAYPYGDYLGYHTTSKATSWHGTADTAVNLHPLGYDASEALTTNGTQQGGWAYRVLDNAAHAMLWNGTADTAVDLHPAAYNTTKITALFGTQQVGEGWTGIPGAIGSVRHALLWNGTADSVVDLNQYLPAGYTHAVATGMDADGNVVGYAYNTLSQGLYVGGDVIAVVFAPGQAPNSSLSSLTVDNTTVAPGGALNATVTLATPASAGGVTITFLSTNPTLAATPAPVTIAENQDTVTVPVQVLGSTILTPTTFKLFASDNVVSRSLIVTVKPIVKLSTVSANGVEGGFASTGVVTLTIPAQVGGAVVSLSSSDPLVKVPATVTVPAGYSAISFSMTTSPVTALTPVTITAAMDGISASATMNLSPQPVVTLSSINVPTNMIGGQPLTGSVYLNNWVRNPAGVIVLLSSGDTNLVQVPASVLIPYGYSAVTFSATTSVTAGSRSVTLKADGANSKLTTSVMVDPIPPVTILTAVWKADTMMLKVDATTPYTSSILTYGEGSTPFGTMQYEAGLYQGSIVLPSMPATVTVWSSVGGSATIPVSTSSVSSGGGGGNTGGGTTPPPPASSNYTLSTKASGKGAITSNPVGIKCGASKGNVCSYSFASGTLVNLTAKPDAGAIFLGWTGDCAGNITSCTVTMDKARSVTANFK